MTPTTVPCFEVRSIFTAPGFLKTPTTLKTATITPLGGGRYEVTTLTYVTELAKQLGRGSTYTHTYSVVAGVFYSEISDGSKRVISPAQCYEFGLYSLPEFNESVQYSVYDATTQAFFASYRKAQRTRKPSHEELAECMNELGPDAVNVITGRRVFPKGKR